MPRVRAASIALTGVLAGCATAEPTGKNPVIPSAATASQLRPGDSLTVAIIGVPDPSTNSVQIDAHRIITINHGEIAESGTHAELLARGGVYATLYRFQQLEP